MVKSKKSNLKDRKIALCPKIIPEILLSQYDFPNGGRSNKMLQDDKGVLGSGKALKRMT